MLRAKRSKKLIWEFCEMCECSKTINFILFKANNTATHLPWMQIFFIILTIFQKASLNTTVLVLTLRQ